MYLGNCLRARGSIMVRLSAQIMSVFAITRACVIMCAHVRRGRGHASAAVAR
jgi:hypothetical protein